MPKPRKREMHTVVSWPKRMRQLASMRGLSSASTARIPKGRSPKPSLQLRSIGQRRKGNNRSTEIHYTVIKTSDKTSVRL